MNMNKKCEVIGYWVGDLATIVRIKPVDSGVNLRNDLFWFKNTPFLPDLKTGDTLTFQQFYNNCVSDKWNMYKQAKYYSPDQIPDDVTPEF